MTRTLIKGGCVLSMNPRIGNHHTADVLIDGDSIVEIGQGISARDAEVIDARNTIVMPGFVDTHRRAADSLFRGSGEPVGTSDALSLRTADDVYAATLVGLLSAVEAGITTVVDGGEFGSSGGGHADVGLLLPNVSVNADLRSPFDKVDTST